MYQRYGFEPFGVNPEYEEFGMRKMLLCFSPSGKVTNFQERFTELAEIFHQTGEIRKEIQ